MYNSASLVHAGTEDQTCQHTDEVRTHSYVPMSYIQFDVYTRVYVATQLLHVAGY